MKTILLCEPCWWGCVVVLVLFGLLRATSAWAMPTAPGSNEPVLDPWMPPRVNDDIVDDEAARGREPPLLRHSQAVLSTAIRWANGRRFDVLVALQVPFDRFALAPVGRGTEGVGADREAEGPPLLDGPLPRYGGATDLAAFTSTTSDRTFDPAAPTLPIPWPASPEHLSRWPASPEHLSRWPASPEHLSRWPASPERLSPLPGGAVPMPAPEQLVHAGHGSGERAVLAPRGSGSIAVPDALLPTRGGLAASGQGSPPSVVRASTVVAGDPRPDSLGAGSSADAAASGSGPAGAPGGERAPGISPAFARACVRAAFRAAGLLGDDWCDSLAARARESAALPELRLRVARTTDESGRLTYLDEENPRYATTGSATHWLEGRLSFRLDRILFADEELPIERLRLERAEMRSRIAAKVVKALADWQRAIAIGALPGLSSEERIVAQAAELEASASLDAWTDGWFSSHASRGGRG